MESVNVFSNGYEGPSYSVKYLGIVDGTMGILSRKMAMPAALPSNPAHYKEVIAKIDTKKLKPKPELFAPVLKGRSYASNAMMMSQNQSNPFTGYEKDIHSIAYQKNQGGQESQTIEENNTMINQLSQNPPTLGQYTHNKTSGAVEIINVKFKDTTAQEFTGFNNQQMSHNDPSLGIIVDDRKSVDKTSNDSPSRLYMRSLMEHSNQSNQATPSRKLGVGQDDIYTKKANKGKKNLKLTGKTIVESGNPQAVSLQQAIRIVGKEGVQSPGNKIYHMEANSNYQNTNQVGSSQQAQRTQNASLYSTNRVNQQAPQQQFLSENKDQPQLDYYQALQQQNQNERVSGYPKPELYNQHYINKYSFPKGLCAMRKPEDQKKSNQRLSLYDMETPIIRKGISGWKLTKRPMALPNLDSSFQNSTSFPPLLDQSERKHSQKKKTRKGGAAIDAKKMSLGDSYIQENAALENEGDLDYNEHHIDSNRGLQDGKKTGSVSTHVRRSVNHDNQLTNIKISYHGGNQQQQQYQKPNGNDHFSGEAQPLIEDPSQQLSPRTGNEHEVTNSFSNRKLQNTYNNL